MKNYNGIITNIEKIALDVSKIDIQSDLDNVISGQFISVLCPNKTLRRPFSISDFNRNKKTLTILVKLKGEGTSYLQDLKKEDKINFLAPLGNGFLKINSKINKKSLLIGAGIGIAPMLFLKKELNEKNIENYLIAGFKNDNEVIKGADEVVIGGSVLDNLDKIVENYEAIYACGPKIVLKTISEIAKKKNIPSFLALERIMACSIGVCRGCVIELAKNNNIERASVCKDGPVFIGDEIIWD